MVFIGSRLLNKLELLNNCQSGDVIGFNNIQMIYWQVDLILKVLIKVNQLQNKHDVVAKVYMVICNTKVLDVDKFIDLN